MLLSPQNEVGRPRVANSAPGSFGANQRSAEALLRQASRFQALGEVYGAYKALESARLYVDEAELRQLAEKYGVSLDKPRFAGDRRYPRRLMKKAARNARRGNEARACAQLDRLVELVGEEEAWVLREQYRFEWPNQLDRKPERPRLGFVRSAGL